MNASPSSVRDSWSFRPIIDSTAGGFHIVLIPLASPSVSLATPESSPKHILGSTSSWVANSSAASAVPTPTKSNFPPTFETAGRTSSRSCDAYSQHRNHPKCRRNAQTANSSAIPKGVLLRQRVGRAIGLASDARTSGADFSASYVVVAVGAMALKATDTEISFAAKSNLRTGAIIL